MAAGTFYSVAPSAARLTESLRDIGYDMPSAVADIVDNSIAAEATRVEIVFDSAGASVVIADDGHGMTANRVNEALRFGSRSLYATGDLGRYGLGLKTASLSQCRSLTVASRRTGTTRTCVRQLDLDVIHRHDEWMITDPGQCSATRTAIAVLDEGMSTAVVWENLDRVLGTRRDPASIRRRVESVRAKTAQHLAMVFHRYLAGTGRRVVTISIDGEKLQPWDPFAVEEDATRQLPVQRFELQHGGLSGTVSLNRWVLPARQHFSSPERFDQLAGPLKWNRQQGLYIYRADRLVQWGGWAGLRAIDEHTKLARASLDFDTDLDDAFHINVAKMKVALPSGLRQMLERPVAELCQDADTAYRRANPSKSAQLLDTGPEGVAGDASSLGLALLSAAVQAGHFESLREIARTLVGTDPVAAAALGLDTLGFTTRGSGTTELDPDAP